MNQILEVGLAGLLHDVGKALQRADLPLSEAAQRMANHLCPEGEHGPTHRHVLWTNELLDRYGSWFPAELSRPRVLELASAHHRPGTPEQWLIAEADRLASGHDRRARSEDETREFRLVPLKSVFGGLRLTERPHSPPRELAPGRLAASRYVADGPGTCLPEVRAGYQEVARGLTAVLGSWPCLPAPRVAEALISLSTAYLARVPASTVDETDVSLHDHARLTAALATVSAAFHDQTGNLTEVAVRNRDEPKYRLVTGDLGGIQAYLFRPPPEGAARLAKAYRARSFYLSLLTHAASLRVLEALGLPSLARVIDAGGRFVLLVPNTPSATAALRCLRAELDKWMLEAHGGALHLTLDATLVLAGRDFLEDRFGGAWAALQGSGDTAKRRRLAAFLQPTPGTWDPARATLPYLHDEEHCRREHERDVALGGRLPEARYAGFWSDAAPPGLLPEPLDVLGYQFQIFAKPPDKRLVAEAVDLFAFAVDDAEQAAAGWRPIAAYVPRLAEQDVTVLTDAAAAPADDTDDDAPRPGRPATFEHLGRLRTAHAADPADRRGLEALACLKADVDRLGLLFSHGFGSANISFGRVACLSRELDGFFKEFLRDRLDRRGSPHRLVYTVFSGGDDLMLVGPWRDMLHLAADLNAWFTGLTGGNPDVTLSAGLALARVRVPVYELARMAAQQLELAKDSGRNRMSVFGESCSWPAYSEALELGDWLDRLLYEDVVNSGFVYRLLRYSRAALRLERARQTLAPPAKGAAVGVPDLRSEWTWRSQLLYDFERNVRRRQERRHAAEVERLENLVTIEMRANPQRAQQLRLAAMYALYRNRGG